MSKERNTVIDLIKGLSIILVVMGHAIQSLFPDTMDAYLLFRVIYSFHMPLFIWISGYTYSIYSKNFDYKWMIKRFKGFVIPFYCWAVLLWLFRELHSDMSLINRLKGVVINPSDNGLWFLITIFYNCLILCLAWYIYKLSRQENPKIFHFIYLLLVALLTAGQIKEIIDLPFRLDYWYIHFFALGFFSGLAKEVCAYNVQKFKWIILFLSVVYYCYGMKYWTRSGGRPTMIHTSFGYNIYRYSIPISAIIIVYILVNIIPWEKINGISLFLSEMGNNSLSIYAMQWFFLGISLGGGFEIFCIRVLTALIMPWAIGKFFISRIKVLNVILLGGR